MAEMEGLCEPHGKWHQADNVAHDPSFGSGCQRTALVHNPYAFNGPCEVVLSPMEEEEEEEEDEDESVGNGSFCPAGRHFNPKPPICTSRMCNAAFAFHVSSCPLARPHLAPHSSVGVLESHATFSLTSSTSSLPSEPRSPVSGHTEPEYMPALLPALTGTRNRHRKMLRALRQEPPAPVATATVPLK
eukprot:GGOE01007889.1.p1 GENE.GGOE01007889.1~~GGOE01007889.1.p1  ORF type:complete len:221 (+),score=36.50 GGOE01007889.1:101-664(+)